MINEMLSEQVTNFSQHNNQNTHLLILITCCLLGLTRLDEQQLPCLPDGAGQPHAGAGASPGPGARVNSREVSASQGAGHLQPGKQ